MSDFGNTLSVDMLPSDEYRSRCDAPVYDMMGRRVTSMVRGGIYVRDGKKFVGKMRFNRVYQLGLVHPILLFAD